MTFFEEVLLRHRDETVAYFIKHAQKTDLMTQDAFVQFAGRFVDLVTALVLTKIQTTDPNYMPSVERAKSAHITVEIAEAYQRIFIYGVREATQGDPRYTAQQRQQIEHMLDQSLRFLHLVVLPQFKKESTHVKA